jgi:hypothetical protein
VNSLAAGPLLRLTGELQLQGGLAMGHFHIAIERSEEIIPRLGKKELHWKKGRSAFELANSWMKADGLPVSVRTVIEQAPDWQGAKFLDGIFERQTNLPGRGGPSQTDLLTLLALKDGNGILGVEGKVDEPFGPQVVDWLEGAENQNRSERLAGLCATLGVDVNAVGRLFYQLLHRTCASIYEAKRFGYWRAVMLVHCFADAPARSKAPPWFDEFSKFSIAVGMPVVRPGFLSPSKICDGIEVRLAWVSDELSSYSPNSTRLTGSKHQGTGENEPTSSVNDPSTLGDFTDYEVTPRGAMEQLNAETLLNIGFRDIAKWVKADNENGIDYLLDGKNAAMLDVRNALYAFVHGENVNYIGKTARSIKKSR